MFGRLFDNKQNKSTAKKPTRARLTLETLEERLVPAGVVTATINQATGALTISSPGGDSIQITETGGQGSITLSSPESITLQNSSGSTLVSATSTAINVSAAASVGVTSILGTGQGNDTWTLSGPSSSSALLTGSLTINENGNVTLDDTGGGFSVGGATSVNEQTAGTVSVGLFQADLFASTFTVTNNNGSSTVSLANSAMKIGGASTFTFGGSGNNLVSIDSVSLGGNVTYTGGLGTDSVFLFKNGAVAGNVSVSNSGIAGSLILTVTGDNLNAGKGNVTATAAGSLEVEVNSTTLNNVSVSGGGTTGQTVSLGVYASTVNGTVTETGTIAATTLAISSSAVTGSVTDTTNGTDASSISISNSTLSSLTFDGTGSQASALTAFIGGSTVTNGVSLNMINATSGASVVSVESTTIGSAAGFAANPSNSFLSITQGGTGNLTVDVGTSSADTIHGNVVIGAYGNGLVTLGVSGTISGEVGLNDPNFSPTSSRDSAVNATFTNAIIGSFVQLNANNATAASTLNMQGTTVGTSAGFAANPLASYVSVASGFGALTANIGTTSAVTVFGNIGIGTAGTASVGLNVGGTTPAGASISGSLFVNNVFAAATPQTSALTATITNATVGGFVSLNANNATSSSKVTVSNAVVGQFFSVATGIGNDTVSLTNLTEGSSGVNTGFAINVSSGNDVVSLTNVSAAGPAVVGGSQNPNVVGFNSPAATPATGSLNFSTVGGVFSGSFYYTGKTGLDTVVLGTSANPTLFKGTTFFAGNSGSATPTDTLSKANAVFTQGFTTGANTDGSFIVT